MRLGSLIDEKKILNLSRLDMAYPDWRNMNVADVCLDSRQVAEGSLFAAIRGLHQDGHTYLAQLPAKAAVAALVETVNTAVDLPQLQVGNVRRTLAFAAARLYGTARGDGVSYFAVTGTDGKTSTNQILTYLLERKAHTVGRIGTPGISYPGFKSEHGSHTTPDSPELHQTFRAMKQHACDVIGMEASSHALDQDRLLGIPFKAAIFTNLSHEHLDYHGTMDEYARAKRRLFENLDRDAVAVLNRDDDRFEEYAAASTARVVSYGQDEAADYRIGNIDNGIKGLSFELTVRGRTYPVQTRVYGVFNAYNMVAALAAVAETLHNNIESSIADLAEFPGVDGRMQAVLDGQDFAVIVDFAVTARAIEHSLRSAKALNPNRIWYVTGAAGERDKTKRPDMSRVMNELADEVILTSDLVFGENTANIIKDLGEYVDPSKLHVIYNRQEAIRYAINHAEANDAVLICGLGDIRFMIIEGKNYYHDDYVYARHCITERLTREILNRQVEAYFADRLINEV